MFSIVKKINNDWFNSYVKNIQNRYKIIYEAIKNLYKRETYS